MAKFIFRLQSFLNLKEKLEDQKKLEYGKALAKLEEERQRKLMLENDKRQQIISFREQLSDSINPKDTQGYNNYIELLKRRIAEQEKAVHIAEKNAEKKRIELVDAMKERKTLETLKEKDREEYLRAEQIAEQKIVDEIVSYQYND